VASEPAIGVLALQGDYAAHARMLAACGAGTVEVRQPDELDGLSGLILPGGESTTLLKLMERTRFAEALKKFVDRQGALFGTCAGMILLATEISDGDAAVFPLLDVTVKRNAFGRQLDSFESDIDVPVLGDMPVHGVFIRAPLVERVGDGVDVLARLDDGRVVAVRQGNVLATAFHPELAGEPRFHRLLTTMAGAYAEPAEGSGRRPHPTRRAQQEARR
jgi:5'-phosphate synthase pdxT subunit